MAIQYTHTRFFVLLAAVAVPFLAQPVRDFTQLRPTPRPNANPTDTNDLRLVGKRFPYDNIPFKADTATTERGTQTGYNRCNSTTEGQQSQCQTAIINSIEDFCIYAPDKPNSIIGDVEGSMVTWCTQPGHGARVIPAGTFSGVQFIKTPSYVEVTGRFDPLKINMVPGDAGGEVDSGGQDRRGNPIGALVYSNNLPSANGQYIQGVVWHLFIGNGIFCMKACDPTAPNALGLCEHVFDTYGCNTNVPAAYVDGVFETCAGDDQKPVQPGVTDIPASSNCQTRTSAEIYKAAPTVSVSGSSSSTSTTGSSSSTSSSTSRPGGSSTAAGTVPSGGATPPPSAASRGAAPGMLLASAVGLVGLLLGAMIIV